MRGGLGMEGGSYRRHGAEHGDLSGNLIAAAVPVGDAAGMFRESAAPASNSFDLAPPSDHLDEALRVVLDALAKRPRFLRHLPVRTAGKTLLLASSEIEWIESARNNVLLHTDRGVFARRSTLAQLEAELDPAEFVRTHRSHLVRIDRILEIKNLPTGDYRLTLRSGAHAPLSRGYRRRFESLLSEWLRS
jgi:DNA-binding LytR/AlgR family response regulator